MTFLPEWNIEKYIHDLSSVCETKNAHVTYKKAGWKAPLMKYKNVIYERERSEDLEIREKCERDLNMSTKVHLKAKRDSSRNLKTEESVESTENDEFDKTRKKFNI